MAMNLENDDRFPIIMLDYSQRHLAVKKELMFDYKTGRMYVVSADDKSVIHDITQQIVNLVNSEISGDSLIITVEGIGKVNLTQYIAYLKSNILHANTYAGKAAIPSYAYDFKTITNKSGIIQMHNVWKATTGDVPYRDKTGALQWTNLEAVYPIQTVNPGLDYMVLLTEPYNVSTVDTGCIVSLSCKNDKDGAHNTIRWKVTSGNSTPTIRFHANTNVLLEYDSDMKIGTNCVNCYTFETWDRGITWFESVKKYNLKSKPSDRIDLSYMLDNYYTKEEVNDLLKWKNNNKQSIEGNI